jgi:hypothetical protein
LQRKLIPLLSRLEHKDCSAGLKELGLSFGDHTHTHTKTEKERKREKERVRERRDERDRIRALSQTDVNQH